MPIRSSCTPNHPLAATHHRASTLCRCWWVAEPGAAGQPSAGSMLEAIQASLAEARSLATAARRLPGRDRGPIRPPETLAQAQTPGQLQEVVRRCAVAPANPGQSAPAPSGAAPGRLLRRSGTCGPCPSKSEPCEAVDHGNGEDIGPRAARTLDSHNPLHNNGLLGCRHLRVLHTHTRRSIKIALQPGDLRASPPGFPS